MTPLLVVASLLQPTFDGGSRHQLNGIGVGMEAHHTSHLDVYGAEVGGLNRLVLEGVDAVQGTAPDGGGYFIGVSANPPESPVGYAIELGDETLWSPERTTSFCSGSTYAALMEALDLASEGSGAGLGPNALEELRMTEADGTRREDGVRLWGRWNADGNGSEFALVDYAGAGIVVPEDAARPGDFANISWRTGAGHSVVFLGWHTDFAGRKFMRYWSSQPSTNGFGDELVSLDRIREIQFVRWTSAESLLEL